MTAIANRQPMAWNIFCRPDGLTAVFISVFAIWMHVFFLFHAGGFWRDEVNLLNLSGRHSLSGMAHDSFPVLMPVLVRGWIAFGLGGSDLSLRFMGMLIGLAIPVALWWASWKICRKPPLLGLALLSLNTTVIMFGDSLRAFGVGSLMILLTTAAVGWFLQKPTWSRSAGAAMLAIFSVQALYQNTVFIAAICFGAWAVCARRKDERAAVKILFVAVIAAVSLLPYWSLLAVLPKAAMVLRSGFQLEQVILNVDAAAGSPMEQYPWVWGGGMLTVVAYAGLSLLRQPTNRLAENLPLSAWSQIATTTAAAFGLIMFTVSPVKRWWIFPLLAMGIWWSDHRFANNEPRSADHESRIINDLPLFAGVTLLVSVAMFSGFLWFAALPTEPWYFLPLLALAAVCFEVGLPLSRPHARAAAIGFALTTVIGAVCFARNDLDQRFTNVDLIAQQLTAQAASDDYIVVSPWHCGITFGYYFKGTTPWNTLPPLPDHSVHRYDLVEQQMETSDALRPVLDQIAATLRSGHRVWLAGDIIIPEPGASPPALPPFPPEHRGWSAQLYYTAWAKQAAQFLSNHSCRLVPANSSMRHNVNKNEFLKLSVAEGWREHPVSVTAPVNTP